VNLEIANGISYSADYALVPTPTPFQLGKLESHGSVGNWVRFKYPYHPNSIIKAMTNFGLAVPINGALSPNITDTLLMLIRPEDAFTTEMLGSIADLFVRPVEN
jgi:hypothetical protein